MKYLLKKGIKIEKLDKNLYFAFVGTYTTSGETKKELLKNIIDCIILNIKLCSKKGRI